VSLLALGVFISNFLNTYLKSIGIEVMAHARFGGLPRASEISGAISWLKKEQLTP
jgi:hypothetical protein